MMKDISKDIEHLNEHVFSEHKTEAIGAVVIPATAPQSFSGPFVRSPHGHPMQVPTTAGTSRANFARTRGHQRSLRRHRQHSEKLETVASLRPHEESAAAHPKVLHLRHRNRHHTEIPAQERHLDSNKEAVEAPHRLRSAPRRRHRIMKVHRLATVPDDNERASDVGREAVGSEEGGSEVEEGNMEVAEA